MILRFRGDRRSIPTKSSRNQVNFNGSDPSDIGLEGAFSTSRYRRFECLKEALDTGGPRYIKKLRSALKNEVQHRISLQNELADARQALLALEMAVRQAHELARLDPLTQLPNHGHFLKCLEQAVFAARRHHSSLSILFLDLDNFKQVNDSYGHMVGDALLRIVGARLKHGLRDGDLVGRIGGDEFACLLVGPLSLDEALSVGSSLVHSLAMPSTVDAHIVHVEVSIGIARYPDDADTANDLIRQADAAMYHAKRYHRGCARADGLF